VLSTVAVRKGPTATTEKESSTEGGLGARGQQRNHHRAQADHQKTVKKLNSGTMWVRGGQNTGRSMLIKEKKTVG